MTQEKQVLTVHKTPLKGLGAQPQGAPNQQQQGPQGAPLGWTPQQTTPMQGQPQGAPQGNPYGQQGAPQANPYGQQANQYAPPQGAPQANPYGHAPQANPYGQVPQQQGFMAPQQGATQQPQAAPQITYNQNQALAGTVLPGGVMTGGLFAQPQEPQAPAQASQEPVPSPIEATLNKLVATLEQQSASQAAATKKANYRTMLEESGVTDPEIISKLMTTAFPQQQQSSEQQPTHVHTNAPTNEQQAQRGKTGGLGAVYSVLQAANPAVASIAGSQQFADYAYNTVVNIGPNGPITLANVIAASAGGGDLGQAVSYITGAVNQFQATHAPQQQQHAYGAPLMGGGAAPQYGTYAPQQFAQPNAPRGVADQINNILSGGPRY